MQQKDKFTPELRILAASLLSMAVILLWAKFFAPKPPVQPQAQKPGITASAPAAATVPPPADGGKPDSRIAAAKNNAPTAATAAPIAGGAPGDGAGGVLGDGSTYSQAKETFTKIKHLVEAAGGTMNDIIRLDIYVTDIRQREDVWKARKEFFTGDFPTSTLVEVRALATPQLLVEVNATGFLGGSAGA